MKLGAVLLIVLGLLGAISLQVWRHFRPKTLVQSELRLNQLPLRPPREPEAPEDDYGEHRSSPCSPYEPVLDTNICDIVKSPASFAAKCVRIAGDFDSDGFEHSVIFDSSCPQIGLEPWTSETATKKLDAAMCPADSEHCGVGTLNRRITARFTGRFVWRPNASRDKRVLEINMIEDLNSQPRPQ